jgi:hypothetical protein|tara:strand:+ start:438 stop:791 length:354 start_codon:yes stop_codon:yes gene_type:complete
LATYLAGKGYENSFLLKRDIEHELAIRINKDLDSCLNYDIFEEKGYVITDQTRTVNVAITSRDVVVKLNYPLSLQLGSNSINIDEFISTIDVPLGELYKVAIDILNDEFSFLNNNYK